MLDVVSNYDFKEIEITPKITPNFSIYDNQTEGFVLCVKANLVNEMYRDYLEEIAKSCKLGIRESEGYLIIHSH